MDGSVEQTAIAIEIDLARPDGRLTFGDLRRAAELYDVHGNHEVAHRLWRAVEQSASELGYDEWVDVACERSIDAMDRAGDEVSQAFRRSGVKFDYLAIAAARADGVTASTVAATHGCSTSTVARAVEFADQRARLLSSHPDFLDRVVAGANPEPLAAFYGVDVNVMRWILATAVDRRRR